MADTDFTTNAVELEERLGRLSKKTGVIAALILDRHTGSIIKTSGNVDALRPKKNVSSDGAPTTSSAGISFAGPDDLKPAAEPTDTESEGLQSFARAIWTFAHNSEALIKDQDPAEDLRLLRLRTKKQEIVIVPHQGSDGHTISKDTQPGDGRYMLVLVHETPHVA